MKVLRVALFLTWHSFTRGNKGVTALATFLMGLVYLNLVYTPSLLAGLIHGTNSKLIDTHSSNIVVGPTDKSHINHSDKLVASILGVSGVTAVSAKHKLAGEIRYGNEFGNWEIDAIDPISDQQVFTTSRNMVEGSYLSPGDTDKIVIGQQIAGGPKDLELYADSLKTVHVGSKVTVTYPDGKQRTYTVKGIFKTGFIQSDIRALVTKKELGGLYPTLAGTASEINVKLASVGGEREKAEELSYLRGGLKFITWQQKAGVIATMTESYGIINAILRTIALVVAGAVVFVVTYIYLLSRKRQVGIQRLLGITPGTIVLVQVLRAGAITLIGGLLAMVVFMYVIVPQQIMHPYKFPTGNVVLYYDNTFLLANFAIVLAVAIFSALIPSPVLMRQSLYKVLWGD